MKFAPVASLSRPLPPRTAGEVVARSVDQLLGFNFPTQIGYPPIIGRDGGAGSKHCAFQTLSLRAGDVCILASDGVFDNLFDEELIAVVSKATPPPIHAGSDAVVQDWVVAAADSVVHAARLAADRITTPTPFSRAAKLYGKPYQGGKLDDITVVVAVAVEGPAHVRDFGPPGGVTSGECFLAGTVERRAMHKVLAFVQQPAGSSSRW